MLQLPCSCESCETCTASVAVSSPIVMNAKRMKPGTWRQSLGGDVSPGWMLPEARFGARSLGQATAAECDYPGGIWAREGESGADFDARFLRCVENTEALARETELADAQLENALTRGGSMILDDVLDRWFGEDEQELVIVEKGLPTGVIVGLVAVGVTATGAIIWALMRRRKR